MTSIKIHEEPKLDNPRLIAAWPGVGNVALIAATHLKDRLEAQEFAEIDAAGFFDPGGVFIKDNLVEAPSLPNGKFFYWKSDVAQGDIIIFLSDAQPARGIYSYANTVIDLAETFGVKRVFTLAAALTEYHPETPRVLAAATSTELLEELHGFNIVRCNKIIPLFISCNIPCIHISKLGKL